LDKESKNNKKMPEDPVDKPTGEEKIQDKAEEAVEEPENQEPKEEEKPDETGDEVVEETTEEVTEKQDEIKEEQKVIEKTPKPQEPSDKKPAEAAEKKEKPKKKDGKSDDFQYIVRLSNTDVDGDKKVIYGLTSIKGIGVHMANLIVNETDIDKNEKIGDLKEADIQKLQSAIDSVTESAPTWMLNHRKDYESGEDIHLIGPEIEMRLRDEINIMKKIRCYRGIRHERGLPVRGQRTRANNRKGLTLGVSKKRPGA